MSPNIIDVRTFSSGAASVENFGDHEVKNIETETQTFAEVTDPELRAELQAIENYA